MKFADYAALPGWNWSVIKRIEDSPKHADHYKRTKDSGDTASRAGLRANHCAILEGPEALAAQFPVYPGKVRRGKAYDAWRAEQPEDCTPLLDRDHKIAVAIGKAVRDDPHAGPWVRDGFPEHVIEWVDAVTGLPCKLRLDYLTSTSSYSWAVTEVKSITSIAGYSVSSLVSRNKWDGQIAHYVDGVRAAAREGRLPGQMYPSPDPIIDARLIVVETGPVHDVGVFRLHNDEEGDALRVGAEYRAELLGKLKDAIGRGEWGGRYHEAGEQVLELQDWRKGLDDIETDVPDGEWQEL